MDLLNGSGVDAKSDIGAADAQSTLSTVGKKYGTNSDIYKKVQKAFEELAQSEQDLNNVSRKRKQADNDVTNTTSKLNKFLNDFRESLSGFMEAFTQVNANIQELPGLFETLGVDMDSGFGQSTTNLANASNSALGAMTDFTSGNYIGALSKGISAFTSLGTAIFGGGESDPHLAEDLERLANTNEALQYAIENLTEAMEDSSVADAADLYEQQKALLDESEANTQQSMQRSGAAYKNGFLGIGGKHSSNKKINDAMSSTEWSRISKIVGKDIDSAGDFWNLTSEEMRKIATDAPDLYAKIKQYADDGYANASQYMDDYIEYAKQREELEEAYYEKLTSYSFDNLRDEFKDFLTDSTMSWADACNNFNEMLVNSIAEALMTEKYDPMIKELYETWAKYMEDGVLDETEQADLQSRRDAIQNAMEQDRQFLGTLSTSATSQSSSSKGYATASQDSIDELNGRFTAVQMDTSAIRETLTEISASIAAQKVTATEVKANLAEIVNISLQALDYLQGIHKNTNELYTMNERLEKIEKNTRNL